MDEMLRRLVQQVNVIVIITMVRSSGNTQPQSSQLAEPLWTDPGLKSEISTRELIYTF